MLTRNGKSNTADPWEGERGWGRGQESVQWERETSRSDGEEEVGLKVCHSARGVKYEVLFAWKMNDAHGLALMSMRRVLCEMEKCVQ